MRAANCVLVAAGQYQDTEGQSSVKYCDVGTYSSKAGADKCDVCPPGYYQDASGQSSCKPCE